MLKMNEMEIVKRAYANANDVYSQMEDDEIVEVLGTEIQVDSFENVKQLQQIALNYKFVESAIINDYDGSYGLDVTFTHKLSSYNGLLFEMYLYAKNDYGLNN